MFKERPSKVKYEMLCAILPIRQNIVKPLKCRPLIHIFEMQIITTLQKKKGKTHATRMQKKQPATFFKMYQNYIKKSSRPYHANAHGKNNVLELKIKFFKVVDSRLNALIM